MILNITRFQADMPYPAVRALRPDGVLAAKLLDGYSGKKSELTTIMQYAYHSLQCKEKHKEVSSIVRGIFYVETLHMEMLGECIDKLGGDTKYNGWQTSLVDYESSPAAILRTDMQGEKYAADFYRETAKVCNQPELAHLLSRLAEDEVLHYRIFSDLYRQFAHE